MTAIEEFTELEERHLPLHQRPTRPGDGVAARDDPESKQVAAAVLGLRGDPDLFPGGFAVYPRAGGPATRGGEDDGREAGIETAHAGKRLAGVPASGQKARGDRAVFATPYRLDLLCADEVDARSTISTSDASPQSPSTRATAVRRGDAKQRHGDREPALRGHHGKPASRSRSRQLMTQGAGAARHVALEGEPSAELTGGRCARPRRADHGPRAARKSRVVDKR